MWHTGGGGGWYSGRQGNKATELPETTLWPCVMADPHKPQFPHKCCLTCFACVRVHTVYVCVCSEGRKGEPFFYKGPFQFL